MEFINNRTIIREQRCYTFYSRSVSAMVASNKCYDCRTCSASYYSLGDARERGCTRRTVARNTAKPAQVFLTNQPSIDEGTSEGKSCVPASRECELSSAEGGGATIERTVARMLAECRDVHDARSIEKPTKMPRARGPGPALIRRLGSGLGALGKAPACFRRGAGDADSFRPRFVGSPEAGRARRGAGVFVPKRLG